jgi:hypothetical protein
VLPCGVQVNRTLKNKEQKKMSNNNFSHDRFISLLEIVANGEENPNLTQVGKRELLKCARVFAVAAEQNRKRSELRGKVILGLCAVLTIDAVLLLLFGLEVI